MKRLIYSPLTSEAQGASNKPSPTILIVEGASGEDSNESDKRQMRPIYPENLAKSFLEFAPLDIAQQLTLRAHYLFSLLPPKELLKKRYDDEKKCPKLAEMSKHFNWVSYGERPSVLILI